MQTFRLRRYRAEILILYILAAVSLAVASFFDLRIDIALHDTAGFLPNWFAETGETPAELLPAVAAAVLAKCFSNKWLKALSAVGCVGAGGFFGDYVGRRLFADTAFRTGYGVLFGVGLSLALLFAIRFIPVREELKKPLVLLSLAGLCACGLASLLTDGMKALWGRVRFRDLGPKYAEFTPWYVINGNTGAHSFPSGHTGGAAMSYLLMGLPYVSKTFRRRAALCFYAAFAYTVTVAATRLIMGAHYLSDVTVGGTLSFTCVLLALFVFEKICCKKELLP